MSVRWPALAIVGLGLSCSPARDRSSEPPEPSRTESVPAEFAPDEAGCVRGVRSFESQTRVGLSVAHNYQNGGNRGYGTAISRNTLRELRALGTAWVSLTPFGFMRGLDATEVRQVGNWGAAETDDRMEREIRAAHELGFRVLLKPHVWIAGGGWRGELAPAGDEGWARWFASYRRFILHYATMAQELSVEAMAVGVEFPTAGREAAWRATIADVREVFTGELVYAANWDAVDRVSFWDAVDAIGVQFYQPLADDANASESQMRTRLSTRLDSLSALSRRLRRPIWITEVGYRSIVGTSVHPHTWPERDRAAEVSQLAQARAYRRFINEAAVRPEIGGVFFWKWFTDPDTDEEGADGFSPRGKMAERVLRSALSARCRPRR